MSEDALIAREQRGNISVLTMVYRPYNLLGPKLINAIVEQIEAARGAGSRAIVLRSGLRHFSAGADLDIFDKRAEQGRVDLGSENRRLNGVEYLRFMELLPMPLIASVHGLQPVWPHLVGEFEFRFPPATSRALAMCSRCQLSHSKND